MATSKCIVLVQSRKTSEYNDFLGKFCHFPQKYKKILNEKNLEFIYYEPIKTGSGCYFGYGRLGEVFPDKREKGQYFIEITEYKPFATEVPAVDEEGKRRESGPGYNAQNSVRRIRPKELEEICLDGGILLNFNADSHLIKVLGEELIASEVVGILELIKNSYDANATKCNIRIEKIPGLLDLNKDQYLYDEYDGPVIVIEDDGDGMDRYTIEHGWLRPASTIKTSTKDILKTERGKAIKKGSLATYNTLINDLKEKHGGRLPLGEKGVGRFATHRLGSKVIITTKVPQNDYEYLIEIDWGFFDSHEGAQAKDLSSIGISLRRQALSRDYGKSNSGTRIIIYGGRKGYELTETILKDVNRSIMKLKSPKEGPRSFTVSLDCPQLPGLDMGSIESQYDPVFTLTALVNSIGIAEIKLKFEPSSGVPLPPQDWSILEYDLRVPEKDNPKYWNNNNNELREAECGSFFLNINFWYRSTPWIAGPDKKDFTQYLDEYGGVSIYRDGLNILPAEWGAEVDWLKLSKRHIKRGLKVSYYNMIGQLEIDQATNINLVDKTDRQGLINNPALKDLSTLTRNLIFYVENHFIAKRKEYSDLTSGLIREPKKLGDVSMQGSRLVDNIIRRYNIAEDTYEILSQYGDSPSKKEHLVNLRDSLKNLNKSMDAMQNVQEMLSEQAGYGLAVSVAVHEIAKMASSFYNGIVSTLRKKKIERNDVVKLKGSSAALQTEIKRLGPIRAARNEADAVFPISKAVKFCKKIFMRQSEKLGVDFIIEIEGDFNICTRYGTVNQVLYNLVDNSFYWIERSNTKEKKVIVKIDGDNRQVLVSDSGPDIEDSIRPYLFEPGYSLKSPPSGLGLYISKYYMGLMGGNIYEAGNKDRLAEMDGAQFVLDFSRVKES